MGLLDQVLGGMSGGGGSGSGIASILMNMLGGQQGGQTGDAGSGVGGLISRFEQAGLGHIASSWVGNGPNQPVSPQQVQSALGDNQVQAMASQSGMAPQDLLSQLSQHLPDLINSLTPHGRLPDQGTASV